MHTTFSISLVTLVHKQGTFAFLMTPQQTSEGGIFGFAGNITYWLHSLIRLWRSLSQPPSAWEPTTDMATTKERTKNKLGSFAMFTSSWGCLLKVTKRTVCVTWVILEHLGFYRCGEGGSPNFVSTLCCMLDILIWHGVELYGQMLMFMLHVIQVSKLVLHVRQVSFLTLYAI